MYSIYIYIHIYIYILENSHCLPECKISMVVASLSGSPDRTGCLV
jgi:hypothetical protein